MKKEGGDESSNSPEETLIAQLPEIANELNTFWTRFNKNWGLDAGWAHFTLPDELGPRDIAKEWARKVRVLASKCDIETIEQNDWPTMVILLEDLSEGLEFYFSAFEKQQPHEEGVRITNRLDFQAQTLLDIFRNRGYISRPFKIK